LNSWCGGTFRGITENLDYIKGMGFTSIWISPISTQTRGLTWWAAPAALCQRLAQRPPSRAEPLQGPRPACP
jgi:hypothetical protein